MISYTVTAGQWLRDQTTIERFATAFATLLVYSAAALASNSSKVGSLFIATLLLFSVGLLGLANALTHDLQMYECKVHVVEDIFQEVGHGKGAYRRGRS